MRCARTAVNQLHCYRREVKMQNHCAKLCVAGTRSQSGKSVLKGKEMADNELSNMSGTDPEGSSSKEIDFQSAMLKMMSDFKSDILANVKESVAQVYQDFGYTEDANSDENHQMQDPAVDPASMASWEDQQGASIIDQITNFTKNKETESVQESAGKSNFESFATQFATGEKTGPSIDKVLSNIMQRLLNEKLPKEKLDAVQKAHLRPENCTNVVAPKINKQIWQQLKQDTKNRDSALQKIQTTMMSSLYAILQVCNNLSSSEPGSDNLTPLTHAAILLMSANRDFNLKRRELLRGDLNKQYASLCNPSVPVSSYLFGDDLNKEVEDLTKANKLGNKVTPKQQSNVENHTKFHVGVALEVWVVVNRTIGRDVVIF
eukprot:gene2378-2741_t